MHSNIFRNYDIRGKYPDNLDEDTAYLVGYHIGLIANGTVMVGFDCRLSSQSLYEALVQGILESKASPLSLGLIPTPVLYFANKIFTPSAAIMITASHNPKGDNGFKIIVDGESFFGDKITELQNIITNSTKKYIPTALPKIETIDISEKYIDRILESLKIHPDLRVVWDPGNGATSEIISKIINKLPNKNFIINADFDGNFPNRPPDPTIDENLHQLLSEVEKNKCDLGIALDGDGDRVVFVTENGKILAGDQIVAIFASEILQKQKGASIIVDIKSSQTLFDYIKNLGGNPIMCKTGHAIIKSKMKESSALLAGELSSHIFFADKYYGYDDGIYAAIRMMNLLNNADKSLEQMFDQLPKSYSTPEIKLYVSDSEKFRIIEEIKASLRREGRKIIAIDGIRCNNNNGWWLLRASNTEAALTARCEGASMAELDAIKAGLNSIIKQYNLKL